MNRRRIVIAAALAAWIPAALAQAYPGGGMGRMRNRNEQRPDDPERARVPTLNPHPLAVLATALERESPSMNLAPSAADAMSNFIRELRDFAALDDKHVRDRVGMERAVVHANVELQHDLADMQESANELGAAAGDVIARWKILRGLLDNAQRERVEAMYSAALIDARQPVRRKPGEASR